MTFASEDVLSVLGFSKTYVMMVTNMRIYVTREPDEFDADFRCISGVTMIAQFEQKFYNKSFSPQDQGKGEQIDTLENRINFCFLLLIWGVQNLIIFLNMTTKTIDWIILFAVQRNFLRLEN